jgi:acetyl-CoA carboxylase biotin carboxylase subunit
MRRALGEYVVGGIKTTLPFFAWLFRQPDFLAGRFHTTYLDELLKQRNGQPFVEAAADAEDVAAIAAALHAMLTPADGGDDVEAAAPLQRWKLQARTEGLR